MIGNNKAQLADAHAGNHGPDHNTGELSDLALNGIGGHRRELVMVLVKIHHRQILSRGTWILLLLLLVHHFSVTREP